MENLRRVLPVLRQHGIDKVTVSFNGEGDSGSIEDILYEPRGNEEAVKALPVEHISTSSFFDDGQWRRHATPEQSTLNEAIDALTYDYLEETNVDWYNNDGGGGEFTIDFRSQCIEAYIDCHYTESILEHSNSITFEKL